MRRIAFYGGTFDPVHDGHIAVGAALLTQFSLDSFVFVPAFHAPHKKRSKPTSAIDRYTMLCLATEANETICVSKIEIDVPERPYTVETLGRLKEKYPDDEIFFVMGADSWLEITTWRDWEAVLTATNHIVVTRPGFELKTDHVTDVVRELVVDARSGSGIGSHDGRRIYFTDTVQVDVSATSIRQRIRDIDASWRDDVPDSVANYIEKYQIYN